MLNTIEELNLALSLIGLLWCSWAFRSTIIRDRKIFEKGTKSNLDEQIRAIETLKEELRHSEQAGKKATLAVVDQRTKDGKGDKKVFQDIGEEIGVLDDLEEQIKNGCKSGKHVRMIV